VNELLAFMLGCIVTFIIAIFISYDVSYIDDVLAKAKENNQTISEVYYKLNPNEYKLKYTDWKQFENKD